MRDSALKLMGFVQVVPYPAVGEELMRDSALKLFTVVGCSHLSRKVGEELMRDSALKPVVIGGELGQFLKSEKSSCATAL